MIYDAVRWSGLIQPVNLKNIYIKESSESSKANARTTFSLYSPTTTSLVGLAGCLAWRGWMVRGVGGATLADDRCGIMRQVAKAAANLPRVLITDFNHAFFFYRYL
jgi:hypothetical protein